MKTFGFLTIFFTVLLIDTAHSVNVVLSFDDGWSDHLQAAQDMHDRNLKGLFFINSERIDTDQRLTLDELRMISDMGHEIGGHTKSHVNLSTQNFNKQKRAICNDRNKLLEWGFNATTFAFPYGADTLEAFRLLGMCGYNGARDSGGIRTNTSCTRCPKSDNIPPRNPQQIRSVSYRSAMGIQGLKWYVEQADQDPDYYDGLLVFIFHEYGDYPEKEANIYPGQYIEFLDWLVEGSVPVVTIDENVNTKVYPNFEELPQPSEDMYGKPYIAFTFDDGTTDHYEVSQLLEQYDMRGTFFVNSELINQSGFLTSEQLVHMEAQGHEIGGHGPNRFEHLISLPEEIQQLRMQTDYDFLTGLGLNITSFAWPYGETNAQLTTIAKNIGYQRARDIGGIKIPTSCGLCPSTLALPLSDSSKMAIRSFNVKSYHTFGDLMWQIFRAEDWSEENPDKQSVLVFNFGTVCYGRAYSPARLQMLLQWIHPRYKIGTTNGLLNLLM